jgi:cell division protein FtsB
MFNFCKHLDFWGTITCCESQTYIGRIMYRWRCSCYVHVHVRVCVCVCVCVYFICISLVITSRVLLQVLCVFPRSLQVEYDRLRQQRETRSSEDRSDDDLSENRNAEMVAEAKLLRQHKGRLEARMRILEDHNRQLEAQLSRLRQLLEQVMNIS